jgi:tRNA(Ser,Leu) C12 N-acetylase TAN1
MKLHVITDLQKIQSALGADFKIRSNMRGAVKISSNFFDVVTIAYVPHVLHVVVRNLTKK